MGVSLARMQAACAQVPDRYNTYIEACAAASDELLVSAVAPSQYYHMIEQFDAHLDEKVAQEYHDQPLAQDWARVCKVAEELGEAISELIAYTGQNPRKGTTGSESLLLDELADVACTAILAIQHFTKNTGATQAIVQNKLEYNWSRCRGR